MADLIFGFVAHIYCRSECSVFAVKADFHCLTSRGQCPSYF